MYALGVVKDLGGGGRTAMSIRIKIKPLSSNACWQGRRFKNKKYKDFEKLLISLLPDSLKIPKNRKLEIKIEFGLSSKLADTDNFLKPCIDVLAAKYGFNDRYIYKITAQKKIVKKREEYIEFQMEGYDEQ